MTKRLRVTLLVDGDAGSPSDDRGSGASPDPLAIAAQLTEWSLAQSGDGLPPRILFAWGGARFRGRIEELHEEWILFEADGTPRRGWLDLVLRR